jgi:DNA topoisomerase IB
MSRYGRGWTASQYFQPESTCGSRGIPAATSSPPGYDKAGRKQYIYHHAWEQAREASTLVTGELAEMASNGDNEDSESRAREAIDAAAERLGNTREVCRDSSVHPLILEANEEGRLAGVWSRAKSGKWISREESALRLLLEESQQPRRAHRSRSL